MYGEKEFSEDVITKFGGSISGLSEEPEILHAQMGYLADGVREKLLCTNDILHFIEGVLLRADATSEIENAVAISFIAIEELPRLGLEVSIPPSIYRVLKEQQQRWFRAKNT
jgi:hypothetical protein